MNDATTFGAKARRARRLLGAAGALAMLGGTTMTVAALGSVVSAETIWTPSGECGTVVTTTVPADVYSMTVELVGGRGGQSGTQAGSTPNSGGAGALAGATIAVTPGETISAIVGCDGRDGGDHDNSDPTLGFSRGGGTGRGSTADGEPGASGGAGGGASAVCRGSVCTLDDVGVTPLVIAAGGGGGGVHTCDTVTGSKGGTGASGGFTRGHGGSGLNGGWGEHTAGGMGGANTGAVSHGASSPNGSGSGGNTVGGGGGGGYVGGRAGDNNWLGCHRSGGGGAGSSWILDGLEDRQNRASTMSVDPYVTVTFADPTPPSTTTTEAPSTTTTEAPSTTTTEAPSTTTTEAPSTTTEGDAGDETTTTEGEGGGTGSGATDQGGGSGSGSGAGTPTAGGGPGSGGRLSRTGSNTTPVLIAGLVLLVTGANMLFIRRRIALR